MYCKYCGTEFDGDFCPNCGKEVIQKYDEVTTDHTVEKGPWKVFAKIGRIFGIVSVSTSILYCVGLVFGIYGIVFSILGKRSKSKFADAKLGLKLSIIGTIIGTIATCVIAVLIVIFTTDGLY